MLREYAGVTPSVWPAYSYKTTVWTLLCLQPYIIAPAWWVWSYMNRGILLTWLPCPLPCPEHVKIILDHHLFAHFVILLTGYAWGPGYVHQYPTTVLVALVYVLLPCEPEIAIHDVILTSTIELSCSMDSYISDVHQLTRLYVIALPWTYFLMYVCMHT